MEEGDGADENIKFQTLDLFELSQLYDSFSVGLNCMGTILTIGTSIFKFLFVSVDSKALRH